MTETLDLLDDLDIDVARPEEYADQTSSLLPKGEYRIRVNSWELARNKSGEIINPKTPIIVLVESEVADGPHTGRKIMYQRVFTTTFDRNGVTVSGFGDLIRAIDASANWQGKEGFEILKAACDQGRTLKVKGDWEAFDQEYYEQIGGGKPGLAKEQVRALRKKATIKGMGKFPKNPDGSHSPVVRHSESGNTLEARFVITGFVRSDLA